eukprot:TRINITY_DN46028_c0_g1_i1.p1 TRINITY_DN46028_c0_g1~~TRINITY_DN46028_c0_g1_i1.p1  ORF type:complete len:425 (+),score=97.36 TRINITY_DN46028_c0_g1_i1:131-1405(+)
MAFDDGQQPRERRKGGGKGGGKGGKGGGSRRSSDTPPRSWPCCFKLLCPEELVSYLMGKSGRTKQQIEEETGARFYVSQRDEHYPGTRFRILTLFHESPDGIHDALANIADRAFDAAEAERDRQGNLLADLFGKQPGEYVLCGAVPHKIASFIIGKGGEKVKSIRAQCQCHVNIDPQDHSDHQLIEITAQPEGLRAALAAIYDCVQDAVGNESLASWGNSSPTVAGAAAEPPRHGKGGGRGSSPRRRSRSPHRRSPSPRGHRWEEWPQEGGGSPEALQAALDDFPEGSADADYSIQCELPRDKVSALIGKAGSNIKEVHRLSGAKIVFEDLPHGPPEHQLMVVKGPLINVYHAHALMMRRYHETEMPPAESNFNSGDINDLQAKLQDLKSQLASVQGNGKDRGKDKGKGGKSKGKGKGKALGAR